MNCDCPKCKGKMIDTGLRIWKPENKNDKCPVCHEATKHSHWSYELTAKGIIHDL